MSDPESAAGRSKGFHKAGTAQTDHTPAGLGLELEPLNSCPEFLLLLHVLEGTDPGKGPASGGPQGSFPAATAKGQGCAQGPEHSRLRKRLPCMEGHLPRCCSSGVISGTWQVTLLWVGSPEAGKLSHIRTKMPWQNPSQASGPVPSRSDEASWAMAAWTLLGSMARDTFSEGSIYARGQAQLCSSLAGEGNLLVTHR